MVKLWESKNAQRALKGSGLTLMAMSLTACGSDSTTADSSSDDTTTTVTPVALSLSSEANILTSADFTAAADTITATQQTYNSADVIVEGTAGDGDTLTVTATDDVTATPTVVGIENVVFNVAAFSTAAGTGTVFDLNAEGIANGTVTVNVAQVGSTVVSSIVSNAGNVTVAGGNDVATLTVNMVAGAATVVNSGEAATVVVDADATTAAELAAQTITVVAADDINLTVTDANNVVISGSGDVTLNASSADLAGSTGSITGSTGQALILAGADTVDGAKISGFDSVSLDTTSDTDGAIDAVDWAGSIVLTVGATADTLTIASGASVSLDADQSITLDINDGATADVTNGVANVTLAEASTTGNGSEVVVEGTNDVIKTVNITAAAAQTAGDLTVTATTAVDVNLSGAVAVDVATGSAFGTGSTLNASALSGALSVTAEAELLTITGGSGDDTITALTAEENVLVGGSGVDTLVLAADMTDSTFSGFEILSGTGDFVASQLSGLEAVVASTATLTAGASSIDTATIDFSDLVIADGATGAGVDMTGATIDTTKILAGQALTITGTAAVDTLVGGAGADTIDGGAGADVITGGNGVDTITGGEGADDITGGAGADVINLTETTAAVDDVAVGTVTAGGIDVITGFTAGAGGDTISFGASAAYTDATADDYDTGNATLTAAATAVTAAEAADGTVEAIAFMYGGDLYVTITDGTNDATYAAGADALVQLVGVDAADLTTANFIA
jgi:Ca2+-binding RTX toxin-like protein